MEECTEESLSTVSVEVPFQQEEHEGPVTTAAVTRTIIRMAPPAKTQPKPKEGKKRRNCTVENCNYSTPYSKDLARHMRKHTGEKPFSCDRCSKCYSRYDKLVVHIRVHENIRRFTCNLCEYAAVDSGGLKKHQRTHSQERPYKCQLCPYAAKDSSQLVVHLRSHTQDSPYFCMEDGCDAAFKTPSDLQRHARTHTGEKPYSCTQCSYRAAVKSNLNVHLKKHHLIKEETVIITSSSPVINSSGILPSPIGKTDINSNDGIMNRGDNISQYASENGVEAQIYDNATSSFREDSLSSTDISIQASIVLVDESGSAIPAAHMPPPLQLPSKPDNLLSSNPTKQRLKASSRSEDISSSSSLPFQYACKQCSYKADTLKLFAVHMKKIHKDLERSNELLRSKLVFGKVGRPRPPRRTKNSHLLKSANELERYYDCSICSASFVREDSLRCHMRQHTDPLATSTITKSKVTNYQQQQMDPENSSSVVVLYNNSCSNSWYQTPTPNTDTLSSSNSSTSDDLNVPVLGSIIHNEEQQKHDQEPLDTLEIQQLQPPSVITENSGVSAAAGESNSVVPTPQHLYIISPGGSTIQSIVERADFILH